MANDSHQNRRSPSTTAEWEWVKIRRRPQGPAKQPRRALPALQRRTRVTVTLTYRGGAQAWILVQARGREWHVSGDRALLDVLEDVLGP